jgi:hypothetical protein
MNVNHRLTVSVRTGPRGDARWLACVIADKLMANKHARLGAKIARASAQQLDAVEHALAAPARPRYTRVIFVTP